MECPDNQDGARSVVMEGPEKEGQEICDLELTSVCCTDCFDLIRERTKHEGMRERTSEVIVEVNFCLFLAPVGVSLAHCVSEDMGMWEGFAASFRHKFKRVGELLEQRRRVGEVAILNVGERYIYYLVTNFLGTGRPLMKDLVKALKAMRDHAVQSRVTKLAMPKIDCGLNGPAWMQVKQAIVKIFENTGIQITVYLHPPKTPIKMRNVQVMHFFYSLENDYSGGVIFFGSADGDFVETKQVLQYAFDMQEFGKKPRKIGDVVRIRVSMREVLYVLVVKECLDDRLSYIHLEECTTQLNKHLVRDRNRNIGFGAFLDEEDRLTAEKVINVLRNGINLLPIQVNLFVYWPRGRANSNNELD